MTDPKDTTELRAEALPARAAEAPAADDGWRPIEGHQFKDHERVLVAHGPTGHVCEAWWCDDEQMFYMANTHPTGAHDGSLPYASEWRPLPEPPRALAEPVTPVADALAEARAQARRETLEEAAKIAEAWPSWPAYASAEQKYAREKIAAAIRKRAEEG